LVFPLRFHTFSFFHTRFSDHPTLPPSFPSSLPYFLHPSDDNFIGKEIYEYLERTRNVPVTGSSTCWQQCDSSFERTEDSWWYTPIKNKQKLRSKYHRRTARKQELKGKEGEAEREGVEEKGEKKREERGWEGQEWDERQRRP